MEFRRAKRGFASWAANDRTCLIVQATCHQIYFGSTFGARFAKDKFNVEVGCHVVTSPVASMTNVERSMGLFWAARTEFETTKARNEQSVANKLGNAQLLDASDADFDDEMS